MAQKLYTRVNLLINSSDAMEAETVGVRRMMNHTKNYTINQGYAGVTPGNAEMEIQVTNAVPQGAFEFDLESAMASATPIPMKITLENGQFIESEFVIAEDSLDYTTGDKASYSFTAFGAYSVWES